MCSMALRTAPCHSSSLAAPHHAHALTGVAHGTQCSSVLMQQIRGDRWRLAGPRLPGPSAPPHLACSCPQAAAVGCSPSSHTALSSVSPAVISVNAPLPAQTASLEFSSSSRVAVVTPGDEGLSSSCSAPLPPLPTWACWLLTQPCFGLRADFPVPDSPASFRAARAATVPGQCREGREERAALPAPRLLARGVLVCQGRCSAMALSGMSDGTGRRSSEPVLGWRGG